jgi:hypothetical protein
VKITKDRDVALRSKTRPSTVFSHSENHERQGSGFTS